MPTLDPRPSIKFSGQTAYRIVVQGALSEHWRDRLAGLVMTTTCRPDEPPRTTLVGPIQDQAELNGVLDTLYSLHLPILTVEMIDEPRLTAS